MTPESTRLDELLDALLEHRLTCESVAELAVLVADRDGSARLEGAQRGARALAGGGAALAALASRVEIPANVAPRTSEPVRGWARPVRVGLAAAVLAMLCAAWFGGAMTSRNSGQQIDARATLAAYLESGRSEGRVIGELAPISLQIRPGEHGAEIVYVRRWLERAPVESVYRVGQDEHGRPIAIRSDNAEVTPRQSL